MANFQDITKMIIKYLIEGFMVAIACFAIPKQSLALDEIALIALVAAMTFSILDTYIPSSSIKEPVKEDPVKIPCRF